MFAYIDPLLFTNRISLTGFPNCSKLEEFEQHEMLYVQLAVKDRANIEQLTGCLFPCTQSLKNARTLQTIPSYFFMVDCATESSVVVVKINFPELMFLGPAIQEIFFLLHKFFIKQRKISCHLCKFM